MRENNGRLSRAVAPKQEAVSAELLLRRAEAAGSGNERDQLAGTVLGCLLLRGRITQRQHDGGQKLAELWSRWSRMAAAPHRHPRAAGASMVPSGVPDDAMPIDVADALVMADVDPENPPRRVVEAWVATSGEMAEFRAVAAKRARHGLVLAILESVCVDDVMPPRLSDFTWSTGWDALRDGLDAAADFFKVHAEPVAA